MKSRKLNLIFCMFNVIILLFILLETEILTIFSDFIMLILFSMVGVLSIITIVFHLVKLILMLTSKRSNNYFKKVFFILLVIFLILIPLSIFFYIKLDEIKENGLKIVFTLEDYRYRYRTYPLSLDQLINKRITPEITVEGFIYNLNNDSYTLIYPLKWYYLIYSKDRGRFIALD